VRFGAVQLTTGDYRFTPPDATHAVFSRTGCVMLFMVPEDVRILQRRTRAEADAPDRTITERPHSQ
jgi:hypothetical protein